MRRAWLASLVLGLLIHADAGAQSEIFLEQTAYIKALTPQTNVGFSRSVALNAAGDVLAVRADQEDTNDGSASAGVLYVFRRNGGIWAQEARLEASNPDDRDRFGGAAAFNAAGDVLVVGATNENSNAPGIDGDQTNNDADNAGAVYVFRRSGGIWAQEAYVKASNSGQDDRFGNRVALNAVGDVLAVVAVGEDSNARGIDGDEANDNADNAGAVYVFRRSDGIWAQEAYVKASNSDTDDEFGGLGTALNAAGDVLAVGATNEDSNAQGIDGDQTNNAADNAGAVYVFRRSDGIWAQEAYVKASNSGQDDRFGNHVALNAVGDVLAVGAVGEDGNARGIDGDEANDDADDSGAVYVFRRSGGIWAQEAYVKASNSDTGDEFGGPGVVLNAAGDVLAVGANNEDSNAQGIGGDQTNGDAGNSGAVYIFHRNAGVWAQGAYVKASNSDAGDDFGAVALSAAGDVLAVGARNEDSSAQGIDGDQTNDDLRDSGAVYLLDASFLLFDEPAQDVAFSLGETSTLPATIATGVNFGLAGATLTIGIEATDPNDAATVAALSSGAVTVGFHPGTYCLETNDACTAASSGLRVGTRRVLVDGSNRVLVAENGDPELPPAHGAGSNLRTPGSSLSVVLSDTNTATTQVPEAADLAAIFGAVQIVVAVEIEEGARFTLRGALTETPANGGDMIAAASDYVVASLSFLTPPIFAAAGEPGTLPSGDPGQGHLDGTLSLTLENVEVNLPADTVFAAGSGLSIYLNDDGRSGYLSQSPNLAPTSLVDLETRVAGSLTLQRETLRISLRRSAPAALSLSDDGAYEYRDSDNLILISSRSIDMAQSHALTPVSGDFQGGTLSVCLGDADVCPEPGAMNPDLAPGGDILNVADFNANVRRGELSDVVTFRFSSGGVTPAMIEAFLDVVEISLLQDATLPQDASVTIFLHDQDGDNGGVLVLPLRRALFPDDTTPPPPPPDDMTPPTVSDSVIQVAAGDTRATLTWVAASDQDGAGEMNAPTSLRYELTLSEGAMTFPALMLVGGESAGDNVYALTGGLASFTLERSVAVLLPGKTYAATMRVRDAAGNYASAPGQADYTGTIVTTSARPDENDNDVHDELETEVATTGDILAYCGGGEFEDSDGDGVPNNVEVRIGTDCRAAAANDFVGAARPTITVSATPMIQTVELGGEAYFVHPGAGEQTRVRVTAACDPACTSLRAYENTPACMGAPGQAGNDNEAAEAACPPVNLNPGAGPEDAGEIMLGSFSRTVVWVGRDANDNWVTATQQFYIAPAVGFDVGRVLVPNTAAMVRVSMSMAVSEDVLSDGDNEADFNVVVEVQGGTQPLRLILDQSQLQATGFVPRGTASTLGFSFLAQTMTNAAPPGIDNELLFTMANDRVEITPRSTPSAISPEFVFVPSRPPLFVDADEDSLPAFSVTASVPMAEYYEVTAQVLNRDDAAMLTVTPTTAVAGVDFTVSFPPDAVQAGDVIEVKVSSPAATMADQEFEGSLFVAVRAAGTVDSDNDGVPDASDVLDQLQRLQVLNEAAVPAYLQVSGMGSLALGSYALAASIERGEYSAEIPAGTTLTSAVIGTPDGYAGTGIFDFSVVIGVVGGTEPGDLVSVRIPLTAAVPNNGGRLFKYDDGVWSRFTAGTTDNYYGAPAPCPGLSAARGDGAGEWRAAGERGLRAGDACLLVEITDGGPNDADGMRNGIIHDPSAVGGISLSGGGGGGGAMNPMWLLAMLLVGLALAARKRKRAKAN